MWRFIVCQSPYFYCQLSNLLRFNFALGFRGFGEARNARSRLVDSNRRITSPIQEGTRELNRQARLPGSQGKDRENRPAYRVPGLLRSLLRLFSPVDHFSSLDISHLLLFYIIIPHHHYSRTSSPTHSFTRCPRSQLLLLGPLLHLLNSVL